MLQLGSLRLEVPAVMGVLNVTPDSFSDGGRYLTKDAAVRRAMHMVSEGAALIDVGGESTRPGASAVAEQEEIDRTAPVIEAIRREVDLPLSIDTSKPGVMRAAVAAGAALINDVRALQLDGALEAAAELQRPVCLMHMQGEPRDMQVNPSYVNVMAEVSEFLAQRMAACERAGLSSDLIVVDPGFGFGKTAEHNIELLGNLRQLRALEVPVLIGVSRKSTLGMITGRDVEGRLPASIAAAVMAVVNGASIVRAHDIAETVDALQVARAVMETSEA
jgi:dihydropteroate synthase